MTELHDSIFELGPHIRYVVVGSGQRVDARQRDGVADASAGESHFYEEPLVSSQVVLDLPDGHLSVCVARDADALAVADALVGPVRG